MRLCALAYALERGGVEMGLFGFRIPGTPIRVYPGSNPRRIARRVMRYQAARAGLYRSPWRLAPRGVRRAYFRGRALRRLFR